MNIPDNPATLRDAGLVVQHVDPVSRELTVLTDQESAVLYVPPDCLILLRGERIKLRLLQPGDGVHVKYTATPQFLMALEIHVQSVSPSRRSDRSFASNSLAERY